MTIRPGTPWAEDFTAAPPAAVAYDDASLAELIRLPEAAAPSMGTTPTAWLRGGDLHTTMGKPTRTEGLSRFPIDVGEVSIDGGEPIAFVAHVVCRRRLWAGRFLVIANAAHLGEWNIAPRGHPNDGRLDVIDGALGWGDRLAARRRLPSGTHLPHPALTTSRVREGTWRFDRPTAVEVDGRRAGHATRIDVRLHPDAASVVA